MEFINLYVHFENASWKTKIILTATTLSRRLTYPLSENSAIKQHLNIKQKNNTKQIASSDVRKILTDKTIIKYKNNNKKRLQILEAICIKFKKINKQKSI